jgi:signal transduction histidine kinase
MRLTMGARFALAIFFVGSLLVSAIVFVQTQAAKRTLQQRAVAGSEALVESLSSLSRWHLTRGDTPGLRRELERVVHLKRIAYIDVFAPDGHPLIQLSNPEHNRGTVRDIDIEHMRDEVLDLAAPLVNGSTPFGRIEVGIWVQGVLNDIESIGRHGLLTGLLVCLGMGIFSWRLGVWAARRLERLSADVKSCAPDDYRHLPLSGNDEITDIAHAFNERQDRLQEIDSERKASEKNRQEMIQMIIHDLKGPLAGFSGGLTMLEESLEASSDPSLPGLLQVMQSGTDRLLRMIGSILEVARLEDRSFRLASATIDLAAIARRRADELMLSAQARGIVVDVEVSGAEPAFVSGDSDLLGRLVDNLLFNALEHSPSGQHITLRVRSSQSSLHLDVRDRGSGIAPKDRDIIFQKFRKGQASSRGVGLGLAFCKLAVERHGGDIGVENAPGGGALFYVNLPMAKTHAVPVL